MQRANIAYGVLPTLTCTVKPVKKNTKKLVFNTEYHLLQVNSIAECL